MKNGLGFSSKKSNSNTASGCGKLYFCKLAYKPDPAERKSGIPAAEGK